MLPLDCRIQGGLQSVGRDVLARYLVAGLLAAGADGHGDRAAPVAAEPELKGLDEASDGPGAGQPDDEFGFPAFRLLGCLSRRVAFLGAQLGVARRSASSSPQAP